MKKIRIAILALQGNVVEHYNSLQKCAVKLNIDLDIIMARNEKDLDNIDGIILPGGESTTISLLLQKFNMLQKIKAVPAIFGTCAGLILMSKNVEGLENDQKTLELMDITISRNAYGRQIDSFCSELDWDLFSQEKVMFIRAPRILSAENNVKVLARIKKIEAKETNVTKTNDIAIVEQLGTAHNKNQYLLGATCHPEMNNSKLTQYFLQRIIETNKTTL